MSLPIKLDDLVTNGIMLAVGYVVALMVAHTTMGKRLARIEGQLSILLRMAGDVDKLKERHVALQMEHVKAKKDIDAAHEKLRGLTSIQ